MVRGNTPSASVVTRLSHYRANATSCNSISGKRPTDGGARGHHRAAPSPPSFTESLARYDTSDFKFERKCLFRILNLPPSWLSEPSSPGFVEVWVCHISSRNVYMQRSKSVSWIPADSSRRPSMVRGRIERVPPARRLHLGMPLSLIFYKIESRAGSQTTRKTLNFSPLSSSLCWA